MKRLKKLLLIAAAFFTFAAAEAQAPQNTLHTKIVSWDSALGKGWGNWENAEGVQYCDVPCSVSYGGSFYMLRLVVQERPNRTVTYWGTKLIDSTANANQICYVLDGKDSDGKVIRMTVQLFPNNMHNMIVCTDYYVYRFIYNIILP